MLLRLTGLAKSNTVLRVCGLNRNRASGAIFGHCSSIDMRLNRIRFRLKQEVGLLSNTAAMRRPTGVLALASCSLSAGKLDIDLRVDLRFGIPLWHAATEEQLTFANICHTSFKATLSPCPFRNFSATGIGVPSIV